MDEGGLDRLGRAALPVLAVACFVLGVGATLAVAGDTLGYDFRAYHQAAVRVLGGQPLYDTSFQAAGGFGLFYYPPTFAPLILPFGWLAETAAVWLWTAILLASFGAGVALLPVTRTVRLWIVLLAGLSWPFAYAVKLGQVGPILFLLFAVGWRWLDGPGAPWRGVGPRDRDQAATGAGPGVGGPGPAVGGRGRGHRGAGGPGRPRHRVRRGPGLVGLRRSWSDRSAIRSRPRTT